MGANGDVIQDDFSLFIAQLKAEKGPFVYIDDKTTEGKKFITWMALSEPSFTDWFTKLIALRTSELMNEASSFFGEIPEWVKGETIQFRKDLYDTYTACSARIQKILAEQGTFPSASISIDKAVAFMDWWTVWDLPGAAALLATYEANGVDTPLQAPTIKFPNKLFEYWKVTDGKIAPPNPLLGIKDQSWLDWALDNWLWIAGGAIGGAVAAGWFVNRGMRRNPMLKNMREGWGQTLKLKSGTYELHPILSDSYIARMKAMNVRTAKKFRVSSGGKSLGELHKSGGRRKWRARSYHGVEKYGNSRAALLEWLKDLAPAESLLQREAALAEDVHIPIPTANITREVL
jgi:hypothetical protein